MRVLHQRGPTGERTIVVAMSEEESTSGPGSAEPKIDARAKRFEAEEKLAIDTLAGWIGHPAVPGIIRRRVATVETVIMPIARHLRLSVQAFRRPEK